MRYDNKLLVDMLSAEYVLGTLKGAARRRFEQLVRQRSDYAQSTVWWETHINLLADTVTSRSPPKQVWLNIESRLFGKPYNQAPWWRNFAFLTGAISAAVAASFATFLVLQSPKDGFVETPIAVAMLVSAQSQSGWHLSLVKNVQGDSEIRADSLTSLEVKPNNSFELWILPSDKTKPISLGLLPQQGGKTVKVSAKFVTLLNTSGLAVSLEPIGGSPTGQPTGAVLYQGQLVRI